MSLKQTIDKYIRSGAARFHMPGHKGDLDPYDITELDFSDDLHRPTGDIAELQGAAAEKYEAGEAHLLVNGSSAGICAMLCALNLKLHRPPRILVCRDCHKSFISGAYFSQSMVCGINPENEPFGTVTYKAVENALDAQSGKPDAVFITSPNYYGMCADTERIYSLTRERGIYLFVDAAHGAHFPFSDELPPLPACDAFVVSTHKTLPALNQTGILLNNSDIDMRTALSMMQTTSPSYPLMLSIESSLDTDFSQHICRIKSFREKLSDCGIQLAEKPRSARYADVTRLCILKNGIAESGYALGEKLAKAGIYAEMSDLLCTVLITSPNDPDEWYDRLFSELIKMHSDTHADFMPALIKCSHSYTDVREALCSPCEIAELRHAVNRRAARSFGVYPPGISYAMPGEVITADMVDALLENERRGGRLFGVEKGRIKVIM